LSYTYKEQLEMLKPLRLKEGDRLRFDCPFCGGLNTFGVVRESGVMKWGCFRASCNIHGMKDIGYSRDGIRFKLGLLDTIRATYQESSAIPDPLVSVSNHPDVLAYLSKVHALRAYNEGLVEIYYSPTEDRVMFRIDSMRRLPNGNIANCNTGNTQGEGYAGRALHNNGPKWKKFGDVSSTFECGKGATGVIVEDAPSACAVGVCEEYTGISILGTRLTIQHKMGLKRFKNLIVCLDPDAAAKSINLASRLNGTSTVSVKLIRDDLKYFNPEDIRGMLATT
jgi:hypothetical protein